MRVKILDAMTSGRLEDKVNQFINEKQIKVLNIQITAGFGNVVALIEYEEE
ncbi:hypothetical protein [Virgibacillus salinus]|uniref:Sporulation protein Cse60 n=1 Tax=Virgibacillus salinus TaxID=553311 RepID=A0A1H1DLP6_9BACI|nr:hypothetical protein [Virgibacillus salinus]SDQ77373.1 hypothetical protein SAMN05216231_2475 [Virgibacillus salinus]